MKKRFLIECLLIMLVIPGLSSAQGFTYSLERSIHSVGLQFAAGMANGAADMMQNQYSISIFPQAEGERFLWGNRQYWDPQISWTNKYENWPIDKSEKFPLSSSALVWTTDGWHLANSTRRTFHRLTVVTYKPPEGRHKFWKKAVDFALMSLAYSAGHITTTSLLTEK